MAVVTEEEFQYWKSSNVTKVLFHKLAKEKEVMKEGLVYNSYDFEDEVKGRIKAIDLLLSVDLRVLNDE